MPSPADLHRRAVDAVNALDFARAQRLLDEAVALTDDVDLLARVDGTRAYALAATGSPDAAEQLCRDALARTGLTATTSAILHGQLGTLLLHRGQLEDADPHLSAGVEGTEGLEAANLLMNRSVVRMQRHRLDEAIADLEHAVTLYGSTGTPAAAAEARHNLGYAALLRGDLVSALKMMSNARPVLADAGDLAAAIADQDRAEVLRDAGLTTEAEELLREAAARFGSARMRQQRAEAELHLARSQLRHDPDAAARTARTALQRFRRMGSTGWAARARAVLLEARLSGRRRPSAAELRAGAEALARAGYRTEAASLRLAVGLVDPAARTPRVTADDPMPLRLRAAEVRTHRAEHRERESDVRRRAGEGLDLLTGWQGSFGALDLQASLTMHGERLIYAGLRSAARTGDAATLFAWSERARHLSQQVAPVRPPQEPEVAADLAELRMLRVDLTGTDWVTDARVKALRDRVRERQWSQTGASGLRSRVTLAEAQALLDDGTVALSYVFTGDRLLCVTTTRRSARVTRLDLDAVRRASDGLRADLDVAALSRGTGMAAVVQRSLDDRLVRLDVALIAPVLPADAQRVVMTVPGMLGGVPWAMLPGLAGRAFTLATSMSRWADARADARPAESSLRRDPTFSPRPHGIADNSVGSRRQRGVSADAAGAGTAGAQRADAPGAPRAGASAGFAAGPRVPRAAEEIAAGAAAWPGARSLGGPDATVDAVTALAADVDVLHIAAHGRHAVDNPLFSGFELADGTLFGYDVDRIGLAPEVVVLSACELGRSSVRWGEEALGMTRVWLHAGSRSVIAAPVVVADDLACELLGAVHTRLAAGEHPSDALAGASASTGIRAPFQVHGDGF